MNKTEIEIEHIGLFALDHELVSYKRSYNNHRTLRERDRLAADNGIDLAFAETKELLFGTHKPLRRKCDVLFQKLHAELARIVFQYEQILR